GLPYLDKGRSVKERVRDLLGRMTLAEMAGLHQAVALEPLFGGEFRRSVGLDTAARDRTLDWWVTLLRTTLAGDPRNG
ncbi:hypothetical protein AB0K48_56360, partial [Nonomuraea sp. NPDC055795]